MSTIRLQRALFATTFVMAVAAVPTNALATTPAPDAGLYTSYALGSDYQTAIWTVCGTIQTTEGCFGSGTLGPFAHAGALIESKPVVDFATGTVIRYIYVVDNAAAPGTDVKLYVYKKVDVVTSSTDTVTVTLVKAVPLPELTGGSTALAYMAANVNYVYVGTNVSTWAVRVQRTNLTHIVETTGVSPAAAVSAITSDYYGNMTVTFGGAPGGTAGSLQFDINGNSLGTLSSNDYMLNTSAALQTDSLPTTDTFAAARMHIWPRRAPAAAEQGTNGN